MYQSCLDFNTYLLFEKGVFNGLLKVIGIQIVIGYPGPPPP